MGFTVKQARQYAGFTQREMAEKLGISRDTYRKIEQSPECATVATAKRISEVVGISIDQIFFAFEQMETAAASINLVASLKKLDNRPVA